MYAIVPMYFGVFIFARRCPCSWKLLPGACYGWGVGVLRN